MIGGFAMNEAQQRLYGRISEFSFDEGGEALSFAQRLARENGWTPRYADRVIEEYRKFMFLAVAAEHPVTPSDQVDQVWHLHLTYTRSYWERWRREVLETPVHHGPTKGGGAEGRKFHQWYENTRTSYRRFFGNSPPLDIWPNPSIRFGDDLHHQRVNTRSNWVIPKPWRRASRRHPSGQLVAPALVPIVAGVAGLSLVARGVLVGFSIAIAVAIVVLVIVASNRFARRLRDKDGCGAGGCGISGGIFGGDGGGDDGGGGDGDCGGAGGDGGGGDGGCGGGGCGGGGCGGGG